jgi:hypothetical protein
MTLKTMKYPVLNVSAATADLVKGIQALYPRAQIVPRAIPLEDEEISVEIRLPLGMDETYQARDRIHELVIRLQEQYDALKNTSSRSRSTYPRSKLFDKLLDLFQSTAHLLLCHARFYNQGITFHKVESSDLLTYSAEVLERGIVDDRLIKESSQVMDSSQ